MSHEDSTNHDREETTVERQRKPRTSPVQPQQTQEKGAGVPEVTLAHLLRSEAALGRQKTLTAGRMTESENYRLGLRYSIVSQLLRDVLDQVQAHVLHDKDGIEDRREDLELAISRMQQALDRDFFNCWGRYAYDQRVWNPTQSDIQSYQVHRELGVKIPLTVFIPAGTSAAETVWEFLMQHHWRSSRCTSLDCTDLTTCNTHTKNVPAQLLRMAEWAKAQLIEEGVL